MPHAVVLSEIPKRITSGESISWTWLNSKFPAPTWTLIYTLVSAGSQIQITAAANGSDHLVEVSASTAAEYKPGEYSWQAHVASGDERYKVADGLLTIVDDLAEFSHGADQRSHVKKVLDALEAAIERRASKTQMKQTVDGIAIEHMSHIEQSELHEKYARKYQKELARSQGRSSTRTETARFCN